MTKNTKKLFDGVAIILSITLFLGVAAKGSTWKPSSNYASWYGAKVVSGGAK